MSTFYFLLTGIVTTIIILIFIWIKDNVFPVCKKHIKSYFNKGAIK